MKTTLESTFFQRIGNVDFTLNLQWFSFSHIYGQLQFGQTIISFTVGKYTKVHNEDVIFDPAWMVFNESPETFIHNHMDKRVDAWFNECLTKFRIAIKAIKPSTL